MGKWVPASCEIIDETAGLTDESVCPTLAWKKLRAGWGRLFGLPTDCFAASEQGFS